jgi:hypothetical protein
LSRLCSFHEDYLRDLARSFPALREIALAPHDTPDVHRERSPDGTPIRVVLVGSKAWDLVNQALTEDF